MMKELVRRQDLQYYHLQNSLTFVSIIWNLKLMIVKVFIKSIS